MWSQVSISLDRPNHAYEAGETARFTLTSFSGGLVDYKIGHDQLTPALETGSATLQPGVPFQIPFSFSQSQPGSVFIWATQNGQTSKAQAIFSPSKIQPAEAEPADFDAFWSAQKLQINGLEFNPVLTQHSNSGRSTTYKMRLDFIDGRNVYGYISVPNGAGPFPAIVHFPPFGQSAGLVHPMDYMCDELGAISVALTIHNAYPDQTDPNAYLPDDPTDREKLYYRYAILAGLHTINYLFSRPDFDKLYLASFGESQGGALAMMVAGLDNRVKLVAGSITALSEHAAFRYNRATGFPNYLHKAQVSTFGNQAIVNATLAAVKYYDVQYFAKRYTGPSLTIANYKDEISPAATIISALNQSQGPQTLMHCLLLDHNHPDEYWLARNDIIRRYLPPTRTPQNNPFPPPGIGYLADAGPDPTGYVGQIVNLNGKIELNGAPLANLPVKWELASGPGTVTFTSPTSRNTTAVFSAPGTYVVRFSATDHSLLASKQRYYSLYDFVKVTVSGPVNPPPTGTLCESKGLEPWWQWIAGVALNDLNKTSSKEQYGDFSSQKAILEKGQTYPIALRPAFSWQTFDEYWRVWVDWNNDKDFEDSSEQVFENHGFGPVLGNIAVPQTAFEGMVKMRISMKNGEYPGPCEVFQFGEVEDYSVEIKAAVPPPPPPTCALSGQVVSAQCLDSGTPYDGSDDRWNCTVRVAATDGDPNGWLAMLNGTAIGGAYDENVLIPNLAFSGTINLAIADLATSSCTLALALVPPAPCVQTPPPPPPPPAANYCEIKANYPWHEWISQLSFNNQTVKNSGKSVYSDFTNSEIPMQVGQANTIRLQGRFSWQAYQEYWKVWIDYNQNRIFESPEEVVLDGTTPAPPSSSSATVSILNNFQVPATAMNGRTRMRVVMSRNPITSPCDVIANGEIEDYTVRVSGGANSLAGGGTSRESDVLDLQCFKSNGQVELRWFANFDGPIAQAVLEKSANGQDFSVLKNLAVPLSFSGEATDDSPRRADNFYRLKVELPGGEVLFSPLRRVFLDEKSSGLAVFPVPAKDAVWFDASDFRGQNLTLTLTDVHGKTVLLQKFDSVSDNFLRADLATVPNGFYNLTLAASNKRLISRNLLVEKGQ